MGRNRTFDYDEALGSALRAFWEHGYDATSMQDLCRAMNIQPGSVYATFGSKRDLFVTALRRYAETVSAEAVARITNAPTGLGGVRDYFAHLIDAMVDGDRRWGCLITNSLVEFATRDPELADVLTNHLANLRAAFAAALTRAAARGELRPASGELPAANDGEFRAAAGAGLRTDSGDLRGAADGELAAANGELRAAARELRAARGELAAEGELRPGLDVSSSADLLVAVVQGMNVLAKSQPGRAALATVADAALAALTS